MWFDRKRSSVSEQAAEHWPTERMILEGHADYATPEDLEALPSSVLNDIAALCEVESMAPDECIPCLATSLVYQRMEKDRERLNSMNPTEQEFPPGITEAMELPLDPGGLLAGDVQAHKERYALYTSTVDQFTPHHRLELYLRQTQQALDEVMHGPPIPPKDVSLSELAALVVGAEKWVKLVDAQGLELAPEQEAVKEEIQRIITKVRPN